MKTCILHLQPLATVARVPRQHDHGEPRRLAAAIAAVAAAVAITAIAAAATCSGKRSAAAAAVVSTATICAAVITFRVEWWQAGGYAGDALLAAVGAQRDALAHRYGRNNLCLGQAKVEIQRVVWTMH